MAPAPKPIDPRGPRFNQAVLTAGLILAFVFGSVPLVEALAVVLLLASAAGPRWSPFLRLYAEVIRPRLAPPTELEDPRPPRFAATVGTVFLVAALAAFGLSAPAVGWVLVLVVAALAGLAAITGICVGCEVYLFVMVARPLHLAGRNRPQRTDATQPLVPERLLDGTSRTWVVFTTPYCATCDPVVAAISEADPEARVVKVDATEDLELANAFRVRTAPTVVLADARGEVQTRLVGPAAVRAYLADCQTVLDQS